MSVLLTSRQPLGVTAEFVMPLAGLGVPDNDDWSAAAGTESVQLFVERMERTFYGAPAAADVHREIVNLCRFVEGSPLAIELLAPLVAQDPSVNGRRCSPISICCRHRAPTSGAAAQPAHRLRADMGAVAGR
ncbi:MAG: hypothetical protein R3A10_04720 [Caldilineaceae bacterium]